MLDSFDGVTVGTRLKVVTNLNVCDIYGDFGASAKMCDLRGDIVTVTKILDGYDNVINVGSSSDFSSTYRRDTDWGTPWFWTPSMFECIVDDDISLLNLLSEGGTGNADISD